MPCYCPACTDRQRRTYTPEYRHACEVQFVIALGARERRLAFFRLVVKHRGEEAAKRLRAACIAAWEAGKGLSRSE